MKRLTTGVVAVLLSVAAAGCGSDGGGEDATAWADKVCTAVKDDVAALKETPDVDTTDLQATKDALVTYLSTVETSLDGMSSAVEEAGTPPVDGGEETVTTFQDQVASAKEAVTGAKSTVESASVDDPAAFQSAVAAVGQELTNLGDSNPMDAFDKNQALKTAYDQAASCKELEA
jgi:hypothetical protein